ncbi:MAG: tripartite tricarboxylate transporter TctB family protein [Halomonas sp.]|nr:tripartite tricarboxylate transporter TctB family protein [Halomonas sp.]MCC5901538.1 tripartite tricarboxylate transporter TctB family protein [Halomonas sp.]
MSNDNPDAPLEEGRHTTLKISKRWLELVVYFVLLAATAFYAREALNLPNYGSSGSVGASGFPLLVAMLISASLVLLVIVNLLNKPSSESELFIEVGRPAQVLLTVIVMIALVLALERVGLIIAITLLAFLLMKLGGETRYSLLLTLPPLLSLGIYVVFVLVLGVYFD